MKQHWMNSENMRRKRTRVQALIEGNGMLASADGGDGDGDEGGGGGDKGDSGDNGDNGDSSTQLSAAELKKLTDRLNTLQTENERLAQHNEKILTQRKQDRDKAEELARKAGDFESIESSYKEKLTSKDTELDKLRGILQNVTAGAAATELASSIAIKGSEGVVRRLISDRLRTELRDGDEAPRVVVLNAEGKPTANTIEDLKEELMNDPALAPIIVGSKAKGAGGSDTDSAGGGGNAIKSAQWQKMSSTEKAAHMKKHPDTKIID